MSRSAAPDSVVSASTTATATSRYVVGLDLGTTNSALAYVDTEGSSADIRVLPVPQLVGSGLIEARETLPSFLYQAAAGEFPQTGLQLPWKSRDPAAIVGHFARDHGTQSPGRLIHSAKSWLCHPGVDRTAELLPWAGAEDVPRLSPVEVSRRYLEHFRAAWDHEFPSHPLAEQDFVLTLPASFDEIARELTVRAAQQAGLKRVWLIEEPQAAFYAWIARHSGDWESRVAAGQTILVVDVGGGTSDFTLIRAARGAGGLIQFQRVAVGEHLILGGDNFDLALAQFVERRLLGDRQLEPRQWASLVRSSRRAKETLLGPDAPERWTVHLPGSGARLIGGGLQCELQRADVQELLLSGFFPQCGLNERPVVASSGFQEFGLPFAADAAITRYLASFLTAHRQLLAERAAHEAQVAGAAGKSEANGHDPARPDLLLLNGGVFESPVLKQRLVDVLSSWFSTADQAWSPTVLDHERLDLAVAKGAAYYGLVRRGQGVRISAGLARSYYVGADSAAGLVAMCLVPAGLEPGEDVELTDHPLSVQIGQPSEFPLFSSSTRLTDQPGQTRPVDPTELTTLSPLRTILKATATDSSSTLAVTLQARLTEIGTLDVYCREAAGKRSWKLLFDVRSQPANRSELANQRSAEQLGVVEDSVRDAAWRLVDETFQSASTGDPATLMKRLSDIIGQPRDNWLPTLLRSLWERLITCEAGRRLSPTHEARWLNLLGYALRPGFGVTLDDWRVSETWKLVSGRLVHATPQVKAESWILWRRISGGLTAGQQQGLTAPLLSILRPMLLSTGRATRNPTVTKPAATRTASKRAVGTDPPRERLDIPAQELAELLRLIGACELLSPSTKSELGSQLVSCITSGRLTVAHPAMLWTIGRLGARVPMAGSLNAVVSPETATRWLIGLMESTAGVLATERTVSDPTAASQRGMLQLAVVQLSRRTQDRYRDLSPATRERVLEWLSATGASDDSQRLVRDGGPLESAQAAAIFGESLPVGLRLD